MKTVIVIGRGHAGTRAIAQTLLASGVHMGDRLNTSNDLVPAEPMYGACRVMARHVAHLGDLRWDFSKLHSMPIDEVFNGLVNTFLASVLQSSRNPRGWKLPETTLVFPWIARLFPDAHFIQWVRDPRDAILGPHVTDDLADFDIPYDQTDDMYRQRAISWKYQVDIVAATPPPKHFTTVRFEDFVLNQERTLQRLETFLEMPLTRTVVRPEAVGRHRRVDDPPDVTFLLESMARFGYDNEPSG